MATRTDAAQVASDLRVVLGALNRRLRAENRIPLSHAAVIGRLDRCGPRSVSDLAVAERVRPQSMAQTVHELEIAGFVSRCPDPTDGRRVFIELTAPGLELLHTTRARRETWLTETLERQLYFVADVDARLASVLPAD